MTEHKYITHIHFGDARIHVYIYITGTISLTFKKSLRKKVYLSSLPEAI